RLRLLPKPPRGQRKLVPLRVMRQIKERSKKTLEQRPANFTGTGKPLLPERRAGEKARKRRTRRPRRRQLPRPLSQAPRAPSGAEPSPIEKTKLIKSQPRDHRTRTKL